MYHNWWKLLGVLIFGYVLIGGMTKPLNPGITSISPDRADAGENVTIDITGYNTHFKEGEYHAWIKLDSTHLLKAVSVAPIDDNLLKASFGIPSNMPNEKEFNYATIITYSSKDGAAVRPSKFQISNGSFGEDPAWQEDLGMDLIQPAGIRFPFRTILDETIRNTFFHVALWLAMIILLLAGLFHAVQYLRFKNLRNDMLSAGFNRVAIFFGILGLITGSIWARFAWGTWWTTDIKLNMSAIAMLIYLAYLILRSSTIDYEKRARLSAVYSLFSFAILIPLIFVIPRMTDSLHPGNGGNPALGGEDLDNTLRLFFYPSIIALILIGTWIATLLYRSDWLEYNALQDKE